MKRILSFILLVTAALNASAVTWYIRTDGADGNDGRSWENAQTTIRLGIDNCKPGDTLLVEEGVYYEGITLKDGVVIIGGCTAYEPVPRFRDHKAKTILDGKDLGTRLVSCDTDIVKKTRLEDFVLQNARHDQRGGGAWLRGKVVMRHCIVRGCSGLQCGGVLIKGDLPEASALGAQLEDCLIYNCSATGHEWPDAGGVANFDGTLNHCTIANCYGDRYGGIHSESSVYACTMWGNRNEYGFVDPSNYVSDESESGTNRADEGFETHFFEQPWLSADNEAVDGPHFRDPSTFYGVPITPAEEAIMLAADYEIGTPTHRIASMPPASPRSDWPTDIITFPCEKKIGNKTYRSADYTTPSFIAFLLNKKATLVQKEEPYCMVANINGDPRTQMAFCWFTNEGIGRGEVQLIAKANAIASDFAGDDVLTVSADTATTPALHYAISTSGILKAAQLNKNTAFRYVSHKALATNLKPGTDYSYRVGYDGHWSEPAHFRTAGDKQEEFSFIYMTDSHIQNQEYIDAARLCAEAVAKNEKNARFCVFPGDFVDTGTDNNSEWEWERWFEEVMKPIIMQMPIVPTDGNHDDSPLLNYTFHFNTDTTFNLETKVRPQFAGINYSFVYGDMQLIAFSEQDFWRGEYDYETLTSEYLERDLGGWFRRQVAKAPKAQWRVGLVHKNLFSGSDHQRDKETPLLRATLLPVMKDCKMDLILQGHDHTYEVIGPVDPDTRKPILSAISQRESVKTEFPSNITGYKNGTYNVKNGTLYFIGATCGAKRYTPLTREEMDASKHIHKVENYFDLFTGMFGQPGAPSYTRVTVKKDHLLLESFKVLENGKTELFNTLKITH
ncbi:MAG: fibronectin type III domain-containing protein [Paludibacteraceae bacterium]|nr:fibronectin type III domain-containing protein [Paludibacteraceae bacterium]